MVDLPVTSFTLISSGDIGDINSAFLYIVNGGNSRQIDLAELIRYTNRPVQVQAMITNCYGFTNGAWTQVNFDSELMDDIAGWDASSPQLIYVPTDEFTYARVIAQVNWINNNTGIRYFRFEQNGVTLGGATGSANNESFRSATSRIVTVSSGDRFGVKAFQSSGITLGIQGSGFGGRTFLTLELFR